MAANEIQWLVGVRRYSNDGYFSLEGLVLEAKCTYLLTICDLASENQPYDIFNPNGVISIML